MFMLHILNKRFFLEEALTKCILDFKIIELVTNTLTKTNIFTDI